MWTPIANLAFRPGEPDKLKSYLEGLSFTWRPSLITWHNTAAPTLAQWQKSAAQDLAKGLVPGQTRINNLVTYFKSRGWSSGPHWFVADDLIWAFTPSNKKGTHSPSWNGIALGIEMVADFSREDDDTVAGLKVRRNTVMLTALLCERLGINPMTSIKLHKEDKKTTHDCPGIDFAQDKDHAIQEVVEYMGHGGEHDDELSVVTKLVTVNVPPNDYLNLRANSTVSSAVVAQLHNGHTLTVWNEAMNGQTKWLLVNTEKGQQGWVSARYVKGEI